MHTRQLGTSGLAVSLIGLGCNNFGARLDLKASKKVVHAALDHGITLFDTADIYGERGGSETCLGAILGPKRQDIVLASKFGMPMDADGKLKGGSRRYIFQAVEASLTRLKTDWIDLYQLHRPDPLTPIEETLDALDDLVRAGKIRYIGCSNMVAWQVADADWTAKVKGASRFISAQDEYSLVMRGAETDLIPALNARGMGLLPYFPLACGLLTGKYQRNQPMPAGARITGTPRHAEKYLTDANWALVEGLGDFAAARGHTLLELAFSWLAARKPVASVIAGATSPPQIAANAAAANWALTAEDLAEIDRLSGHA